jgi:hypothetical protein
MANLANPQENLRNRNTPSNLRREDRNTPAPENCNLTIVINELEERVWVIGKKARGKETTRKTETQAER